jgi:hypothetical protein
MYIIDVILKYPVVITAHKRTGEGLEKV